MSKEQDQLDQFVASAVTKAEPDGFTKAEADAIKKQGLAQAGKLKDVNLYLAFARQAVSFVRKHVKYVANWDEPHGLSFEAVMKDNLARVERQYRDELSKARSDADAQRALANRNAALSNAVTESEKRMNDADKRVYHGLRQKTEWQNINNKAGGKNLQDITTLAALAREFEGGNCGELTSLAFMHLHGVGVRPLEYVSLVDPSDHGFLVIGRKDGTQGDPFARTWGKSAVVCDPWAPGVMAPLPPGIQGPMDTFGESYAVYTVDLLESKMKAMHKSFRGVTVEHRED